MADAQTLSDEYSEQLFLNTIVRITAAIFGIFGNSLVILMYTKYVDDKTGCRYFIPVLAVVDLVGTVSNVTEFYLETTMRFIYPGVFLCKMLTFLIVFTGGFSAHLILAIALQRYLIICRPFGHQMFRGICRIATFILFLFSVAYASPVLKFKRIANDLKSINVTGNVSFCHIDDGTDSSSVIISYLGTLLFLSFINILITSILYIPVIRTIYQRLSPVKQHMSNNAPDGNMNIQSEEKQKVSPRKDTNRKHSLQANDDSSNRKRSDGSPEQKAKRNISVMYLVIIIVYVVSYLTSLITHIYHFASSEEQKGYSKNIYIFCLRFHLLNHIANPYIYWIFDIKFRNELRKFCCSYINKS